MTRAVFNDQVKRLMGLQRLPPNFDGHYELVQAFDEQVLTAAVTTILRIGTDFPVPMRLRDACLAAQLLLRPTKTAATVGGERGPWKAYCDDCHDTGWRECWCGPADHPARKPWLELAECDRPAHKCPHKHGEFYGHEHAQACHCVHTNPAVKRRKEQLAERAADRVRQ